MEFEVIPAIDVMGGRLVRLRKGDPASLQRFSGDPLVLARRFVDEGAAWIHFVDLDAAFGGGAANLGLLSALARLPVRVQAGGGLRVEEAEAALAAGAERAVIGANALVDRETVERAVGRHGERVAVALDVRGGRIVPRGSGTPGPPLDLTVRWLSDGGVGAIVYTNVDHDGTLTGPDLDGLRRLAARTDRPVIASGGVASAADVGAVAAIGAPVHGVIVGRALYERGLSVTECRRALGGFEGVARPGEGSARPRPAGEPPTAE